MKRFNILLVILSAFVLAVLMFIPDTTQAKNESISSVSLVSAWDKNINSGKGNNSGAVGTDDGTVDDNGTDENDNGGKNNSKRNNDKTNKGEDQGNKSNGDGDEVEEEEETPHLKVFPKRATVVIGETIKFEAEIKGLEEEDAEEDDEEESDDNDNGTASDDEAAGDDSGDDEADDGEDAGDDTENGEGEESGGAAKIATDDNPEDGTDNGEDLGDTPEGDGGDTGEGNGGDTGDTAPVDYSNVTITWDVRDPDVGVIDEEGLFEAVGIGEVTVTATAGDLTGTAVVIVAEEGKITGKGDGNSIGLFRQLPNGRVTKFGATNYENDTITIGGMPYPLNILNGSKIHIPENALSEDINITFELPKFAKSGSTGEEVYFKSEIIMGVTFEVTVNGEVVSSYYFDEPLEISLPYKRGLMEKLDLAPEDLGMFFASDSGEIEEDPGITDIAVDDKNNRITGKVAHFSTIVIAPKAAAPISVNVEESNVPDAFSLFQNMPNPFNPSTTISFQIPETSLVTLCIYNMLGQEIRTLKNSKLNSGSYSVVWDGRDNMGNQVTSGVYIYQLNAGGMTQSRKLMLLK